MSLLLTEEQPDPLTWPYLARVAPDHLRRLDADALDWLRLALRHTAHGLDLRIGGAMESENDALRAFWAAGWIRPVAFGPDMSQRAWALVNYQSGRGASADEVVRAQKSRTPNAYWWGPGPDAADALALLPKARGITPGDVVRYAPEFLRSIGMYSDPEMMGWRGTVLRVKEPGKGFVLADVEVPEQTCGCWGKQVGGSMGFDPECDRCKGRGKTTLARVNVRALRRVDTARRR